VIYEVFYGMVMGNVFEERLRMQRDARQLDEETVRLLQETYEERDLLHRMMQASLAEKLLLDDQVMKGMPASEGVYHRAMENAIDKKLDAQKKQMALDIQRKRILRPSKVRLQVVHLQRQTQWIQQHQPRSEGAGEQESKYTTPTVCG
jgi:hypothetical protein